MVPRWLVLRSDEDDIIAEVEVEESDKEVEIGWDSENVGKGVTGTGLGLFSSLSPSVLSALCWCCPSSMSRPRADSFPRDLMGALPGPVASTSTPEQGGGSAHRAIG